LLSEIHLDPIRFRHFLLLTRLDFCCPATIFVGCAVACPELIGFPTGGKIMAFVVMHRNRDGGKFRGRSMLRVGRLLANRLCAMHIPTPEERANLYVSLTPIAVLSSAPGGESPHSVGNHR
jgi:hypothetical protein